MSDSLNDKLDVVTPSSSVFCSFCIRCYGLYSKMPLGTVKLNGRALIPIGD